MHFFYFLPAYAAIPPIVVASLVYWLLQLLLSQLGPRTHQILP